eukprot:3958318-Pyramimonas_sp.AAC.2
MVHPLTQSHELALLGCATYHPGSRCNTPVNGSKDMLSKYKETFLTRLKKLGFSLEKCFQLSRMTLHVSVSSCPKLAAATASGPPGDNTGLSYLYKAEQSALKGLFEVAVHRRHDRGTSTY